MGGYQFPRVPYVELTLIENVHFKCWLIYNKSVCVCVCSW